MKNLPPEYWNVDTFTVIGNSLGVVGQINDKEAKFHVKIDATKPLRFSKKAQCPDGVKVVVELFYENLKKHCLTYCMISHEDESFSELTEEERRKKMDEKASLMRVYDEDSNKYRFEQRPSKARKVSATFQDLGHKEFNRRELVSSLNRQTSDRDILDQRVGPIHKERGQFGIGWKKGNYHYQNRGKVHSMELDHRKRRYVESVATCSWKSIQSRFGGVGTRNKAWNSRKCPPHGRPSYYHSREDQTSPPRQDHHSLKGRSHITQHGRDGDHCLLA